MKKFKFLAAVCCMAAVFAALSFGFVSCENPDDEPGFSLENVGQDDANSDKENAEETPAPVTYTLTVLSSDEAMGTVTGGGTYEEGTEVSITATPTSDGYAFVKWSDENTDKTRTLTVTGNTELTAIFDYAYVDLGLPSGLKWATCNVGATKSEEYGDYFAWGETETKTTYNWSTYKWCNGTYRTLTKYCTDSYYGTVDHKTVLDLEDDAARANWGGAWRMPTDAEWTELRENCTWTWTFNYSGKGVNGRIVWSNINGNSIFLPAAGYREYDGLNNAGYNGYGCYWSSSFDANKTVNNPYVRDVYFRSDFVGRYNYSYCCGLSVRPVLGE